MHINSLEHSREREGASFIANLYLTRRYMV